MNQRIKITANGAADIKVRMHQTSGLLADARKKKTSEELTDGQKQASK